MEDFLNQVFLGNTVERYLIVTGAILLGILLVKILKRSVFQRIKLALDRTKNNIDNYIFDHFEKFLIPVVYFSLIYGGVKMLDLSFRVRNAVEVAFIVFVTYFSVRLISSVILLLLSSYVSKQENGQEKVKQLGGVMLIINVVIWSVGLLFLLDNLGYNITAIITGLGIGGIAIALAAQNILGDLFNYFVIFFDRPFEIGDYLVIDDKSGTVDYIGVKTTRIRSLTGEQLVFSNGDLMGSRIHNYKKLQRRRIVFSVGVTYETSSEILQQIPGILKAIIESSDQVDFDRAHFKSFGDSSLDFEVVYHVKSANFNVYMDIQQNFNFQIYEKFAEVGAEMAFPTRTLYIRNENGQKFETDLIYREMDTSNGNQNAADSESSDKRAEQ